MGNNMRKMYTEKQVAEIVKKAIANGEIKVQESLSDIFEMEHVYNIEDKYIRITCKNNHIVQYINFIVENETIELRFDEQSNVYVLTDTEPIFDGMGISVSEDEVNIYIYDPNDRGSEFEIVTLVLANGIWTQEI